MSKTYRIFILVASLATGIATSSRAIENISSVSLASTTGTPSQSEGLTFDNNIEAVTAFSGDAGGSYTVMSTAPNALVQRNGTPDQSSVWYVINGGGPDYSGVHQDTYGAMLKSNNIFEGADNVFDNGTSVQSGNIERLDFTWNVPFTNLNQLAFAVFDRGNVGAHDAFTIAIVTGVDANGKPTSYGGFLKVAANWGSATNPVANQNYGLFRYSNGDNITAANSTNSTGTQGIGGVVIKVSDLNLAAGTQVYGYSLTGGDVNPTTPSDLLDVTNTSVYPANTTDATGGGIDLAAINGLQIQYVPEPGTWACLGVGGLLAIGIYAGRRRGQPRMS